MRLYEVIASCHNAEYDEKVFVYDEVKESPKQYTFPGRRVLKSDIGEVKSTAFQYRFSIVVTKEAELKSARERIYTYIKELVQDEFNTAQSRLKAVTNHDTSATIKWTTN